MASGILSGAPLRWERLRALLILRGRLTVRLFAAEQGRLFLVVMLLIAVLPLMAGLGFGTAVGYLQLPQPWPAQLLAIVLVALWLAWMLIPLVAFSMNESMDITRLLVYPLSRSELIISMLLGTLFDIPTYIMLPLFIAIVVGWAVSPALVVLPFALLLAYAQLIFSSQILLTALGGILASRRFRDVLIVLGAVLGSTCYLLQRGVAALVERFVDVDQLQSLRPITFLRWLPAGNQAQVIASAAEGDFGAALLWLGIGLLWVVLLAWIWWQLSVRLVTGNGFALRGFPMRTPQPRAAARPIAPSRAPRWLPADLHQLILKEVRLVWRTPQRRVGLLQGVLLPLVLVGYTFVFGGVPDDIPPVLGFIPPLFAVFTTWIAAQNALGAEEKGLPLLSLTPLPRERYWLGKGLATLAMIGLPMLVLALVAVYLLPGWQRFVGLLLIPGVLLCCLAVSNIGSIFFPYPVRTDGKSVKSTTRGGCIAGIGNGLIMPMAIGLVNVPPALFQVGAQFLDAPWLGYVGVLFTTLYGLVLFYFLGVKLAGRLLLQREAELIAATRPPEAE